MAMNFIRGEFFQQIADGSKIFYSHTHEVAKFLENPPKSQFVLITHNSDGKITKNPKRFDSGSSNDIDINKFIIPENLIMWYGQNVDVIHEKIQSIPIGLENGVWFQHIQKENKINSYFLKEKKIKNLLYVCHNIDTNPKERAEPYEIFKNKNWVTIEHGVNGQNFDRYIENIHSHKFVLCPEGNGTDTHRTWETLYTGSIPIEKRNLNNRFYQDLPICFVDNWSEISESFLENEYYRIKNSTWNLEKLDFNFWKSKINLHL